MEQHPLEYEPRRPPPAATPRTMFYLMLPTSLFLMNWLAASAVEQIGGRAMGLMCFFFILLPAAPAGLIFAVVQALRKKGGVAAFAQGLAFNVLLVAVVAVIFLMRGYRL
jgi:hypothetical protein